MTRAGASPAPTLYAIMHATNPYRVGAGLVPALENYERNSISNIRPIMIVYLTSTLKKAYLCCRTILVQDVNIARTKEWE